MSIRFRLLPALRPWACGLLQAAVWGLCSAQGVEARHNWFNDPFFQLSNAIPDCPVPAGPYITEDEKRAQAHHRAERGTTCWLSGQCDKPNFYAYDPEISDSLKTALQRPDIVNTSTLWVTVQGRVVYIEGCAANAALAEDLESLARAIPRVQQALALLRLPTSLRPPYKLRSSP